MSQAEVYSVFADIIGLKMNLTMIHVVTNIMMFGCLKLLFFTNVSKQAGPVYHHLNNMEILAYNNIQQTVL